LLEDGCTLPETEIIVVILSELKCISSGAPFPEVPPKEQFELPQWISAGGGRTLIVNRKISDLILKLANLLYSSRPGIANAISRNDWARIVRNVIGPLLVTVELDGGFEAKAVNILDRLRNELDTLVSNSKRRVFLFGCSFIQNADIPPFEVGPVTVWKREKWLEVALEKGQLSKVSHARLLARWKGSSLKGGKDSRDSAIERAVADAVGDAPYVCTVETEGLLGELATEKAVMSARFALLGVALMWASPTKAMADLNLVFDGIPHRRIHAIFQDGAEFSIGSRWANSLHGLSLIGDDWEPLVQDRADWWRTLGEVIDFWLSPDGKVPRPKLMNQLVQALIWFNEACREPIPMIATTKFVAALDALACGGRAKGIKALITSRLGVMESDPIRAEGPSFSKLIDDLYSDGRSRLIHGSSDRIGHDWQQEKGLAESIGRFTLIMCLHWAADNQKVDDPKLMSRP
jgi:hypothetical protein